MMAKATDNQHPDQEMRRDKRFQVSQAAIITQPGHTDRDCLEALVRSILETGSFLGIKTVAGCVEDAETQAKGAGIY